MKRCLECNRTYSDESLSFCLADGALLSASVDPAATLHLPEKEVNPILTKPSASQKPKSDRRHILTYIVVTLIALLVGGGLVILFISDAKDTQSATNLSIPKKDEINPKHGQTPEPQNNSSSLTFTTGNFQVEASSFQGTPFTNPVDKVASIQFAAFGQWAFWPEQGFHSAEGNPSYPVAENSGADYKLPSAALGSLVVLRNSGLYEYVGGIRTIELKAQERVFFVMNDSKIYPSSYKDNQGILTIYWKCLDCN